MSGSVGLEGADGSWLILDVAAGRINGVEVAVWPDVRKLPALAPPTNVEDVHVDDSLAAIAAEHRVDGNGDASHRRSGPRAAQLSFPAREAEAVADRSGWRATCCSTSTTKVKSPVSGSSTSPPCPHRRVITTIVLIRVDPTLIPTAANMLAGVEGVTEVYSVSGDWDLVAIVRVRAVRPDRARDHGDLSDRAGHSAHADAHRVPRLLEEGSSAGLGHRRRIAMSDRAGDYIVGLFGAEDQLLASLREEADRTGLPPIAISADEGRLLQVLLTAINARRVLEVGTLGGYSAICMARALPPGGRLLSIEIERAARRVRAEVHRARGPGDRIEVRVGRALDVLPALDGERFDAIFLDADKEPLPTVLRLGAAAGAPRWSDHRRQRAVGRPSVRERGVRRPDARRARVQSSHGDRSARARHHRSDARRRGGRAVR